MHFRSVVGRETKRAFFEGTGNEWKISAVFEVFEGTSDGTSEGMSEPERARVKMRKQNEMHRRCDFAGRFPGCLKDRAIHSRTSSLPNSGNLPESARVAAVIGSGRRMGLTAARTHAPCDD